MKYCMAAGPAENIQNSITSAGDAAWGTPSRAQARMGEDAAAGPAEKGQL